MSRRCDLTGKGVLVGHKVSHSNIKTKRRFLPNLLNVTMISDTLGRSVKLRVSANALKTVDHRGGLDAYLMGAKDDVLAPKMRDLKKAISKKQAAAAEPFRPSAVHGRACPAISILRLTPTSVNCSSSVRCSSEKLSSEISVSTSAPAAVAVHRQALHVVDLGAHVGEDQLAAHRPARRA